MQSFVCTHTQVEQPAYCRGVHRNNPYSPAAFMHPPGCNNNTNNDDDRASRYNHMWGSNVSIGGGSGLQQHMAGLLTGGEAGESCVLVCLFFVGCGAWCVWVCVGLTKIKHCIRHTHTGQTGTFGDVVDCHVPSLLHSQLLALALVVLVATC